VRFGDILFEGGKDVFSGAIQLAQHFLPGKDTEITHALIAVQCGLAIEAVPKQGVQFREFTRLEDLRDIRHVMRLDALQNPDGRAQVIKAGLEAFTAFLGEEYSFGQVLLHKFNRKLATEMRETFGATFCSALVKRVLTVARLAEGLSPILLMSPSELHAELSAASGWRPVSIEEFGRQFRGLTESERRHFKKITGTTAPDVVAQIKKQNEVFIKTCTAIVAVEDATGDVVLASTGRNLKRNADDPFDLLEEASIAIWWRELGCLLGRSRWKLAKSESLYREEREKLANQLRAAALRLSAAETADPVRKIVNKAETLIAARDLDGLEELANQIAPFCEPAVTIHYGSGRDALVKADDRLLNLLGQAIESRLMSLQRIREVQSQLAHLLGK
jgi:hypothetical protein